MKITGPKVKNTITYRYLFKRDNLLATILVFLLIGIFAKIERTLSIFDPQEISTKDFNFTDLAYKLLDAPANMPQVDTGIVIVNVGDGQRSVIAAMINKIAVARPKVIGVDVIFGGAKDSVTDNELKNISRGYPNVVMSYMLDSANNPQGYFYNDARAKGYVNFTAENQNVIREFEPFITEGGKTYSSFAAAIVQKAAPGAYDTLKTAHPGRQVINYRHKENNFIVLDSTDVLHNDTLASALKNKIVLLGYISKDAADCNDRHFTPMNSKIAGKSLPDLNGVIIHANIIRMMLDHNYIYSVSSWLTWLIAFVICWMHMAFFIGYYIERHIWFHLAAKLAQLISAIFFVYLGLFIFFRFNVDIDLTVTIFAIVLAVDVLYFYEAGVVWLYQKKGYKTLFHHEEHH